MNSTLPLTKTHTLDADAVSAAARTAPAPLGRTLPRRGGLTRRGGLNWDLLAAAGLLVSSGVYGIYAITQMTGF